MDIDSGFRYHYVTMTDELKDGDPIPADFEREFDVPSYRGRIRCCHAIIDHLRPEPLKLVDELSEKLFKQPSYVPSGQPVPNSIQYSCKRQILLKAIDALVKREQQINYRQEQSNIILFTVVFGAYIVNHQEEPNGKFVAASKSAIDGLEEVSCLKEGEECVICLGGHEEKKEKISARKMPCGHVYHQDCIVEWLQKSNLCPLCRYAMPVDI